MSVCSLYTHNTGYLHRPRKAPLPVNAIILSLILGVHGTCRAGGEGWVQQLDSSSDHGRTEGKNNLTSSNDICMLLQCGAE